MNKKQLNDVKRIVKADCQIASLYLDREGRTCAIGALALAARVPKAILLKIGAVFISNDGPDIVRVQKAINKRFGLSVDQMHKIQDLNDSEISPRARRKVILSALTFIETTP